MASNSLYFISPTEKNYKKIVKNALQKLFPNSGEDVDEFNTNYLISLDVSHASGYSFNASPIIIESAAIGSMIMFWRFVLQYVMLYGIILTGHGYQLDLNKYLRTILIFINYYSSEYKKLGE